MQILKTPFSIFLAEIALLSTLAPYLFESNARVIGYAIASGIVFFISFTLLTFPSFFRLAVRPFSNSIHFWMFGIFFLVSQFIAAVSGSVEPYGLVRTIVYLMTAICAYFVLPTIFRKERSEFLWDFLAKLGAFFSFIGIIIMTTKGIKVIGLEFNPSYSLQVGPLEIRSTSSIFFDPNYFALIPFFGFIGSIESLGRVKSKARKLMFFLLLAINSCGLFFSYSRAAYVGIAVAILIWFLTAASTREKIVVIAFAGAAFYGTFVITSYSPQLQIFLQVDRGLAGRELLWPAAVHLISERPIVGWGIGNVGDVIFAEGIQIPWKSSHNSFLDFALMNGIPSTLVYLFFIAASISHMYSARIDGSQRRVLLSSIIGMVALMQFTTHTVGGISFGSFVFTVLLGMASASPVWYGGYPREQHYTTRTGDIL